VKPLTLFESLKSLKYRFWDEPGQKLVGVARMRQLRNEKRRERNQQGR
jgi:hypothetical protein